LLLIFLLLLLHHHSVSTADSTTANIDAGREEATTTMPGEILGFDDYKQNNSRRAHSTNSARDNGYRSKMETCYFTSRHAHGMYL
jgi:hypothetical protein